MMARPLALTLGLATTTRGYGWVAMQGPFTVYDHGAVFARTDKNLKCVQHFERLVDRLQPELIIMERPSSRVFRSKRVLELHQLLKSSALLRGFEVRDYPRDQVQQVFHAFGAQPLQDIAEQIAVRLPDLAHKLPRRRAPWDCEDRRMGRFFAAALVMAHFQIDGTDLDDRMRP